jgi:hypothetical protein
MCVITLLVLEPYLQVTPCSAYHVESFLKGLHSRFVNFLSCKFLCSFIHMKVVPINIIQVLEFCNKIVSLQCFYFRKEVL